MAEVAKGIIDIEINTGSAASQLQALQAQINAFNLALNKSNKAQGTFAGEYSRELQSAINKTGLFTAETVKLSTAASTLDKNLSKGKSSLGQFFSAKFNKDSAIAAETMALAAERAKRLQTQFIATSGAANGFQDALAVRPLAAFSSEAAVAAQKTQILSNMFKQGTTQLINFGKNVQWAGRQLMVGFTVPLTIFGAMAGKTFMDLEKQMVAFRKVYGDITTTAADTNKNLEAVKGLAAEYTKYGIAVKDTIGLAAQAAAAGRQGKDLTDTVSQATRLATLGQMDQNAALETTISLQSAFKLSGQELADTVNFLNMVENQTVVSLQDIAAAIPRVAPVIQGLGGDVKDLTVFLAAMQEGGVNAEEGANALKSGLASLINPTKQATEMLSGMGISLDSIIQSNKGDLMGTVMSFSEALKGLDQFSRQQALEQVFGKFQYAKLGALFDNISRKGSQAQQVIATMGYTTEQLGTQADKELKIIEESFGVQLTAAVEKFKLAIAPIGKLFVQLAIPVVNFITKIVDGFNSLSDGQKKFTAIGVAIVGIVIPALTMMAGLFLNLVGTLAKMSQGMALFSKGFITGGPIGAFKALSQSSKYLSLAEIDAAMAAQQLSGASQVLNATLIEQVGTANAAATAIANLTKAYSAMIATQGAASNLPSFGVAGAAGNAAKGAKTSAIKIRGIRRNSGGGVPGSGNTDTVPAMLTPGEFVVNKQATKENIGLLKAINDGKTQGLNKGGIANGVQYLNRGAIVSQARSILDMVRRGGMGSLDDFIKNAKDPKVSALLQRYGSVSRSGGSTVSKSQMSPTIKRSTEKTHFGDKQQVLSVEELALILGTKGGSKRKIAEALIKGGIPVQSLTDDWILLPKSINQAARANTTTPMNLSSVIKELKDNVGAIKFKDRNKDSAFSILNPKETSSSFSEKMSNQLEEYIAKHGDVLVTDDILTLLRNRAYKNMVGAGTSTGIRLPSKTDIGTLAGVDINSPSFTKAVNDYFKQNNIPLSADQIVPKKPGSNNWWALQLLDAVGGNITNVKNKFASSTGFNQGGVVPGSGSSDTVPAMLTPGEFVVNKKAASQNQNLLQMMNGGQVKGYKKGGLVQDENGRWRRENGQFASSAEIAKFQKGTVASKISKVATSGVGRFAGGTIASIGGYSAGKALTGGNEIGGIIGSIVGPMLPKAATAAAAAMGLSTAAFVGIAAPLALAGFAIYKFNKQIGDAEKSGAEFTNAMYGTSKTIEGIAEQFGTQTNAQAARISAVERIGGQVIGQQAQQQSAQFVQSDAGKQMVKDIGTVKAGGGNAVEALRNQLSAAIISGAIGTEEAKAIAVEVGTAIGDQSIAVGVSGELTRLMGPDGKDLLKNLSSITAEISPKIDATKLATDATSAYEKINVGAKFIQLFQGGEADFIKNYKINEVSAANSAAFAKEAQARELLNLAYQEGTITLKEFQKQSSIITQGSQVNQDLAAKALGFENQSALVIASQGSGTHNGATVRNEQQRQANDVVQAQKKEVEDFLLAIPGQTEETVAKISASITKLGAGAFGDILSGKLNLADIQILVKLKDGGLTEKEIQGVNDKLQALKIIPDINTLIDVKTTSQAEITQLYDALVKFDEMPDKELNIYAKDNFTGVMQQIGASYDQFAALPDLEKRVILAKMEVLAEVRLTLDKNMSLDQGSRSDYAAQVSKIIQSITSSFKGASGNDGSGGSGASGSGGGGKSGVQTLKQYIKEFEKATKAKIAYFNATKSMLGAEDQEILALIDTEMYLKANATQRKHLLDLAKDQLNIQKATAYLMMSAQEKELQGLDAINKGLDIKSQKDNALLRARQRDVELNNRALDKLSEKEDAVNKEYDIRIEALDKVAKANDRLAQQDRSRVDLATALASGDIAGAANAANTMQEQSAQYQIEDARAALEAKRQEDLKNLTVSVNGVLMTRAQIEASNKTIQDQITVIEDRLYVIETERFKLTQEREKLEMAIYLLQQKQNIEALRAQGLSGDNLKNLQAYIDSYNGLVATAQAAGVQTPGAAANTSVGAGNGSFTSPPAIDSSGASTAAPAAPAPTGTIPGDSLFNQMITMYEKLSDADRKDFDKIAEINPGTNYSKWISRRASGKISDGNLNNVIEAMKDGKITKAEIKKYDKLLKFHNGGKVPGSGMKDNVPALLTPGEFVVRKPVAEMHGSLLDSLNGRMFPGVSGSVGVPTNNFLDGIGSPRYSIPEQSTGAIPVTNVSSSQASSMYNSTYNVNVNVSGTNASPDDIANVVMAKLSQQNRGNLRSSRY
jgi:TP901 family phage tail tape measure protein